MPSTAIILVWQWLVLAMVNKHSSRSRLCRTLVLAGWAIHLSSVVSVSPVVAHWQQEWRQESPPIKAQINIPCMPCTGVAGHHTVANVLTYPMLQLVHASTRPAWRKSCTSAVTCVRDFFTATIWPRQKRSRSLLSGPDGCSVLDA